jgi:hypothetical protein
VTRSSRVFPAHGRCETYHKNRTAAVRPEPEVSGHGLGVRNDASTATPIASTVIVLSEDRIGGP